MMSGQPLPPHASDWLLHPLALGPMDQQHLFELSIRLKYLQDPRISLPALNELTTSVLLDFPAEALMACSHILVSSPWGVPLPGLVLHVGVAVSQPWHALSWC